MRNRVARAIVGVLALILFGYYTYKQEQIHTHSRDEFIVSLGPAVPLHPEGFEEGVVMGAPAAEPAQMTAAAEPAAQQPAAVEQPAVQQPAVLEQPAAGEEQNEQPPVSEEPAVQEPAASPFDLSSWEYMLVNADNSIAQYEPPQLAYLNQTADETDIQTSYNPNRCPVDARIAEPLLAFARGCKDAGLPVFLSSGYRSYSEQAANFQRVCENNGVSDGKDANGHYITMPAGCSEHQTGLCCDITDIYRPIKNAEIEKTATYQWLLEHCAEYGFIHRFPSGKEDVTGVMYEPFHFRYVGVAAAQYIESNGITLEEFWQQFGNGAGV